MGEWSATSSSVPTSDDAAGPADEAERFVDRHERSIEVFTRVGWLAKGAVYVLFGLTAVAIARQAEQDDEASPQGALGQVMEAPAGRALMALMAVGLLLYSLWRAASVVAVDGDDLHALAERVGYGFSSVFYLLLGYTAARSAWIGQESDGSNTVESVSTTLLENTVGRWVLGAVGLVTIAVGLYFTVSKGVMRGFADDVRGVTEQGGADGSDTVMWVCGIAGWCGRGLVTILVGYFIVRSAVTFDASEARGFDRALREAASTTIGSLLVWMSAIGLIAYGVFCLMSHRRRSLGGTP